MSHLLCKLHLFHGFFAVVWLDEQIYIQWKLSETNLKRARKMLKVLTCSVLRPCFKMFSEKFPVLNRNRKRWHNVTDALPRIKARS